MSLPIHFDCMGNQIQVGDYVAIAQRSGNSSRMCISYVIELDMEDGKNAVLASGAFEWSWREKGFEFKANSKRTKTNRLNESVKIYWEFTSCDVENELRGLISETGGEV